MRCGVSFRLKHQENWAAPLLHFWESEDAVRRSSLVVLLERAVDRGDTLRQRGVERGPVFPASQFSLSPSDRNGMRDPKQDQLWNSPASPVHPQDWRDNIITGLFQATV